MRMPPQNGPTQNGPTPTRPTQTAPRQTAPRQTLPRQTLPPQTPPLPRAAAPCAVAPPADAARRVLLRRGLLGPVLASLSGPSGSISALAAEDTAIRPGRVLSFPQDHGAHIGNGIEWWYVTGWLQAPGGAPGALGASSASNASSASGAAAAQAELFGFQLTFFRSRTGVDSAMAGRFVPRQLLFAHAALSDIAGQRHHSAQRLDRWSGDAAAAGAALPSGDTAAAGAAPPSAHAALADTALALGAWTLSRSASGAQAYAPYQARVAAPEAGFTLALQLQPTQPLLLQGQAGYSQKGPLAAQASHYYSQPQLAVSAVLTRAGRPRTLTGRGWLDHEWSDALLAPGAVGWDWIGINLADGGALTAFVLRRADGSALWAGGSHRPAGGAVRNFAPTEVGFEPQRTWRSPATGTVYPVQWRITTPHGTVVLRALLDAQELDSSASTGTVYWEGLAELLAPGGARIGLGYLEMTGRGRALRLGL